MSENNGMHDKDNSDFLDDPDYQPAKGMGMSIASLIFGILSLITWGSPCFGFVTSFFGLLMGIVGRSGGGKMVTTIGMILSAIGLALTVINMSIGIMTIFG